MVEIVRIFFHSFSLIFTVPQNGVELRILIGYLFHVPVYNTFQHGIGNREKKNCTHSSNTWANIDQLPQSKSIFCRIFTLVRFLSLSLSPIHSLYLLSSFSLEFCFCFLFFFFCFFCFDCALQRVKTNVSLTRALAYFHRLAFSHLFPCINLLHWM